MYARTHGPFGNFTDEVACFDVIARMHHGKSGRAYVLAQGNTHFRRRVVACKVRVRFITRKPKPAYKAL